jgi:hypothetical protein
VRIFLLADTGNCGCWRNHRFLVLAHIGEPGSWRTDQLLAVALYWSEPLVVVIEQDHFPLCVPWGTVGIPIH